MSIDLFFEKHSTQTQERRPTEAIPTILWKCGRCHAQLRTTGGRVREGRAIAYAKVSPSGEVQCSYCGEVNTLQPVKWSGQF